MAFARRVLKQKAAAGSKMPNLTVTRLGFECSRKNAKELTLGRVMPGTCPAYRETTKSILRRRVERREIQRRRWGREIDGSQGDVNLLIMCFSHSIRMYTCVSHMSRELLSKRR